jgi:formylglycine-generating enzyme required for sulfatase activity
MVQVPGGAFQMGDNFGDGYPNETVHTVTVSSFYMDVNLVTQGEYTAWAGSNPSYFVKAQEPSLPADTTNYPVERVSWNSANAYCSAQGKRLPTEAEWEYAARNGGQVVRYGTGSNDISCATANIDGCTGTTSPVGHYAPNALGLYDMAGNVWEWVSDWYGVYPAGPVTNPTGPGSGTYKVIRGGSWFLSTIDDRASTRNYDNPAITYFNDGFRCAK